jgi:hypothetical protein
MGGCEVAREGYPDDFPMRKTSISNGCPDLSGLYDDSANVRHSHASEDVIAPAAIPRSPSLIALLSNNSLERGHSSRESGKFRLAFLHKATDTALFIFEDGRIKKKYSDLDFAKQNACSGGVVNINPPINADTFESGPYGSFVVIDVSVELYNTDQNKISGRYVISNHGLISLILPVYVDSEYWLLWRDRSHEMVRCQASDGVETIVAAEECLLNGGTLVDFVGADVR